MHHSRARPPGGRVKTGLVSPRPGVAIAAERGVDQPLVERRQIVVRDPEAAAHRRRVVGYEDIGAADQAAQHGLPRGEAEVERQAFLVAPVELETGIAFEARPDRPWPAPARRGPR